MVGEKIRVLRQAQGRSLADVAAKAKVSVATLSRIENEKQSMDLDLFLVLARVLQVSPTDILEENGGSDPADPLVRRITGLHAARPQQQTQSQ